MTSRTARLAGVFIQVAGVLCLAAALLPEWRGRLGTAQQVFTPGVAGAPAGFSALCGITLIMIGRGVIMRRRVAWLLALAALVLATATHLLVGPRIEAAALTLALAGVLVWQRQSFVAEFGTARMAHVAKLAGVALGVDLLCGVLGLLVPKHNAVDPALTPGRTVREVGSRLIGVPGPLTIDGRLGQWLPDVLTLLGMITLILVLAVAMAPVALPGGGARDEVDEAARLLDRPDGDTLDPFVLRHDKRRLFSADRHATIGFRYVRGVALASGDPVGDPESFPSAVSAFLATCDRNGWRPAVMGLRAELRGLFEAQGLRTLYIGDEAVVDVAGFNLAGRRMRNARQAVNRSINAGVTTEFHREADLPGRLREELLGIGAAQRGAHPEFGFSMALGDQLSGQRPRSLVVVCRDRDSRPIGFQRYVPCRQERVLSLDMMQRLPGSPNGVNERMIADALDWARRHGVVEVSLNFAAFRGLLDEAARPRGWQAVQAFCVRRIEGRFGVQIDTLRRFNAKFQPRWIPRYLAYRSRADLPAIGVAAFSAEGFLPLDQGRTDDLASVMKGRPLRTLLRL